MNIDLPNSERNEGKQNLDSNPTDSTHTIGKEWKEGDKEISLQQIAFVRAVNELEGVNINEDGEIILPSLASRTKGKVPRLTTHTAINHLVGAHAFGSWFTPEVTVIMPGESTIKKNGKPQNIRHADSFWYGDIKVPKDSILIWKEKTPEKFEKNIYTNINLNSP